MLPAHRLAVDTGQWASLTSAAATVVLVAVTVWYAGTTRRLLAEAEHERRGRDFDRISAQAQLIAGFIENAGQHNREGLWTIGLHLCNSSDLPARCVNARLVRLPHRDLVHTFDAVPVLLHSPPVAPRGLPSQLKRLSDPVGLVLELEFDDDNGRRWLKYGPRSPLELLGDPYRTADK